MVYLAERRGLKVELKESGTKVPDSFKVKRITVISWPFLVRFTVVLKIVVVRDWEVGLVRIIMRTGIG